MPKKKNERWMKFRHRIITELLRFPFAIYVKLKYGIKVDRFREQGKRPYLILLNHQTPFDQFFVGLAFKGPVYYMATEDIFSMGWLSDVIRWLVNPIPIKKQTTDVKAVITCIRVAREGGTIAIAPEGNRTYSGKTEYIDPAIVALAKKLAMPIALYRIEGGYGVEPRWSDVVRKGKMRGYVSRVIEPEEYADMTTEELLAVVEKELYVNEANAEKEYKHKKLAEYLERAIYVCPECGLSVFESENDIIECKKCGLRVRYTPTTELVSDSESFKFRFVNDWYEYQKEKINSLDTSLYIDEPLWRDVADMSEVIVYERKEPLREGARLALYGDRMTVDEGSEGEMIFPFDKVTTVAVLGRNKLNVYHEKRVYQFKGDKRFNALKYVNICYRHKNICKGALNEQFLGL